MRWALLALLLSACAGQADRFEFVRANTLDEVRDARNCGSSVLPNYGCWRRLDATGGCKIIVQWPRHSADGERLRTLGLEVWKCAEGNTEY